MRDEIAVVILAGGEGRRIGGNKPGRLLNGKRLIDRALDRALSWSELVAISVRDPATLGPDDVPILPDTPDIGGPLAGLASALRFAAECGCDLVLVIPADMPFVPPDLPDRLIAAIGDLGCAIASSGGHLHPVCGLWRATAAEHLAGYLAGQGRSVKGFAAMIGFREVEWPCEPLDPFFNINTADELIEAERRLTD
jgi:molybdopterin-guanine dinucleotide biosynthesis protein A